MKEIKESVTQGVTITLSKKQCPSTPDEQDRMRVIHYASTIGSVMYTTLCTRPDVSYILSAMSKYQSDFGEAHWTIEKNILNYLRRNKCSYYLEVKKSSL
jgi:hypothetical protein